MDKYNTLISEQKYICIDNKSLYGLSINVGEIYIIYKYENNYHKDIFYRIHNNRNEWKHSYDKNSPFEIRLKESFISLKEQRKLKIQKIIDSMK